ncbi:nucleoside triphosphate pyrophosphohydrolase [Simiduia aestuariiviva]|uniref:ATP diphosphatase n=1 Tax=Simiduia aestuariiviva TaxID=1510459 RepID=A0A839UQZ5_9GAMM|nr:nucleoside triphosphate pyrophosphohydrolase [Simiduia aestuariiviva]MBB3168276.1 ATP diphosphatase [Simiduia aestuariiviva]
MDQDISATQYTLGDLLYLMERLRDPDTGCSWDVQQTFATIVPSTLEEAYEVADAIERGDFNHLGEELGDLLFQVIFYAQLGREKGYFDFNGLVSQLTAKLIGRHPHVFPDGQLRAVANATNKDDVDVKAQWESLKTKEREKKGDAGVFADVPLNLPSVSRAQKLQKRAANVGFDFESPNTAMMKVREELQEVEHELQQMQGGRASEALGEELGDLLFSVVNVCRLSKFDAESLLRATNRKFEHRFGNMERQLLTDGVSVETATLTQMEAAWQAVKALDES